MAKYRKLPVEIEAYDVVDLLYGFRHDWTSLPKCISEAYENNIITAIIDNGFIVNTLEGKMRATKEDYLIKGVDGEFYPCKKDIFKKTYEKVGE